MGANSSPPASDAATAAAAALKNKKRKTSDAPLPIGLTSNNKSDGVATPTAIDADSLHTEATLERIATAIDLSHSLLNRALLDPTLPKSTSLTMEDSRSRLEQLASFVDALRAADVEGVATQLQLMFVSDVGILSTLRDAAGRALDDAHKANNTIDITRTRRISSASNPSLPTPPSSVGENATATSPILNANGTANTSANNRSSPTNANANANGNNNNNPAANANDNTTTNPSANQEDDDVDMEVHEELHEEEAAQALTGLRLSSTASASVAASAAAAVAAVAAAGAALPSPRPVSSNGLPPMSIPPSHPQPPPPPTMAPTPTAGARDRSAIPSSVPYTAAPLPSLSPTHALSIFAPQPSDLAAYAASGPAGLFVTAPHPHSHGHGHGHGLCTSPLGTPGSLPSLFARGLLAPISTPYDPSKNDFLGFVTSPMVTGTTPLGTPMLTPHGQSLGPFVDWKSLAPPSMTSTPSASAGASCMVSTNSIDLMPGSQTSPTETTAPPQQPTLTPVTNVYRPSPRSSGQASPVKRKSITSKQLVEAAVNHGANLALPIAKSLAALERTHPARKANPRRWTKEEDDALRQAVENHKEKNWKAIAAQVPGRNHTQCLQRWTKVLAPGLVKGHWSPHEDELLKRLVAGGNKNWGEVAAKIPGRTSKQCRERWHNHLDPNIVRGAYSPEEDRIILEAQARLGNRWSVIAAMLPGRTEDAVKIRWKSHCRLWKARKYLRKAGGGGDDDDDLGPDPELNCEEDSSDDDGDAQSFEDHEERPSISSQPVPASVSAA